MKLTIIHCQLEIKELNDSQSTNRRGETNETPNKLQLICHTPEIKK